MRTTKLLSILLILLIVECTTAQVFDESNILTKESKDAIEYYVRSISEETNNKIEFHTTDVGESENTFTIIYTGSSVKLYDTTDVKLNTKPTDSIPQELLKEPTFLTYQLLSEYKLKHNLNKPAEKINHKPITTTTLCGRNKAFIGGKCCNDENNNNLCDDTEPACNPPNINLYGICCLDNDNNKLCDNLEHIKSPIENTTIKINSTHSMLILTNATFKTTNQGKNKPATTTTTSTIRQTTTSTTIVPTTTIKPQTTTTTIKPITTTITPTTINPTTTTSKKYESENRVTKLPDPVEEELSTNQVIEYVESNKTTVALGVVTLLIVGIAFLWLIGGDEDQN